MIFKKLTYALAGLAMLASVPANAASTFLATGASVPFGENVPMSSPINQNVLAGQIHLTGPDGALDVWCLDLLDVLTTPYLYNVTSYTAGDVHPGLQVLNGNQVRQIASLMFAGAGVQNALDSAATQLAIWKVEYGALFNPVGLSAQLDTLFNGKLLASVIGGLIDCPGCTLTVLTDAPQFSTQALGFAELNEVPIPGAVWLFASGLGGLVMISRRRKKNQAALAAA